MARIHFIGIGGVGMNGLAQLASMGSHVVTGSDRSCDPETFLFKCLVHEGVELFPQDGSGITEETDQVVYSTAIEDDNPDLQKAKLLGIPLLHRAEFLNQLIGDSELIAVAGTAGKTTTTGLLGWIFECMGLDPTVYNGAAVLNWKSNQRYGNVRKGTKGPWIIEADESDGSFLNFRPTHSIITNISKDHFELDELHEMFNRFETLTSGATIRGPISQPDSLAISMPGRHNQENACCAFALCQALGMDERLVRSAIASFKGIERRLETVGISHGVTVIDDYAHNPAKIAATLSAVAEGHETVHAYWRPHGFGPLAQHLEELANVFARHHLETGGSIFILPVYYAGGSVERNVSSEDLVDRILAHGAHAETAPGYDALKKRLEDLAKSGDAVVGMGARDPMLPNFARQLVDEWKTND